MKLCVETYKNQTITLLTMCRHEVRCWNLQKPDGYTVNDVKTSSYVLKLPDYYKNNEQSFLDIPVRE